MAGLRWWVGLALVGIVGNAEAEETSGDAVLQSLTRCRTVASSDARLACFEQATTALEAAVRAKNITIVDRQDVRKVRRSLFGFSVPHIPFLGGGERDDGAKSEELVELSSTIASVAAAPNGRYQLRLAEGDAVWMTTDPMDFPPKIGAKVTLRRGAMGNYFIAIAGQRSIRGMRVR